MKRVLLGMCVVALSLFAFSVVRAEEEEKVATIKQIMRKANSGRGLVKTMLKELKSPKWDELKKDSKMLVKLAMDLTKNKPSKGSEESWKKLSGMYLTNAKNADKAIEKMDTSEAGKSLTALTKSCGGCHKMHK